MLKSLHQKFTLRKELSWIKDNSVSKPQYLLFVGSPRTGSSFLGQVINYHPHCLVATEYSVAAKVVVNNRNAEQEFLHAAAFGLQQFTSGLENDAKYGKSMQRYQGRWQSMADLANDAAFKKAQIVFYGDKKAGGTSKIAQDNPEEFKKFVEAYDIKLLHLIRNPVDAAESYMKSHNVATFEQAVNDIIQRTAYPLNMKSSIKASYYRCFYEDILNQPQVELKKMFDWMGVDTSTEWLEKIAPLCSPQNKKFDKEKYELALRLCQEHNCMDLCGRYFVDLQEHQ